MGHPIKVRVLIRLSLDKKPKNHDSNHKSINHSDQSLNTSDFRNRVSQDWTQPKFKQFPSETLEHRAKVAFADSFYIAWRGHAAVGNTEVFNRYFKPRDAMFVRQVFKEMFEPGMWGPSPLFTKMTIFHGPNQESDEDQCTGKPNQLGYFTLWLDDPDGDVDLVICPRAMALPNTQDKHCSGLSDHVDYTFLTLGSVMLHEYTHWPNLLRNALRLKNPPVERIWDFKGPDPKNGYGPYNVLQVREKDDPTANADSFSWFATEAYWHQTCRPGLEQYGPGVKDDPTCDTVGKPDLGKYCHPV